LVGTSQRRSAAVAFAGIYRQWKGPINKEEPNADIEVAFFSDS
jgi:hypothetical protein